VVLFCFLYGFLLVNIASGLALDRFRWYYNITTQDFTV
jgi:hypothetical protein